MIEKIENVALTVKANIYFDGKVVSHTIEHPDGSKQTAGLIYPGSFTFSTGAAERMDIIAGACRVRLAGQMDWQSHAAGGYFEVPARSSFDISVETGITEYLCTFL
jgi:uncharacterized protein YaiE (UPF0345 family)